MTMSEKQKINLNVNGSNYEREIEPRTLLSDFIRQDIDLTGTHVGCEHGICGSCTVLLDGLPVRSCLTFAVQAEGRLVETVESLDSDGELSVLQNAFWEHQGLQCGFCTPGMIMQAIELVESTTDLDDGRIREGLKGNICRCTGYQNIVKAIQMVADTK